MANETSNLKDKVYNYFKDRAGGQTIVTQEDVLRSGIIPEGDRQMAIFAEVQSALVTSRLWKYVTENNEAAWRVRTLESAKKYRGLKGDEELVYGIIDEAGQEGIWSKSMRGKLNIHETHFNTAIKHLASKNLIKEMRDVEHPSRKMWIKSDMEQSERSKGGVWYTDGELDEFFVATVAHVVEELILRHSLYRTSAAAATYNEKPARQPKKTKKTSAEEAKALRDKALGKGSGNVVKTEEGLEFNEADAERLHEMRNREIRYEGHIPMPAGFQNYPTVDYLTEMVLDMRLTEEVMTSKDLKELLDVMVWDGKIEEVKLAHGTGYKTSRQHLKPDTLGPYNVFSDAPCGRCPVFNLCEEGGPVGPSNCEYLQDWLMDSMK